jgi:mitochondrial fission protein ELM1
MTQLYAQLNDDDIEVGATTLDDDPNNPNLIAIENYDVVMGKRYDRVNEVWIEIPKTKSYISASGVINRMHDMHEAVLREYCTTRCQVFLNRIYMLVSRRDRVDLLDDRTQEGALYCAQQLKLNNQYLDTELEVADPQALANEWLGVEQ